MKLVSSAMVIKVLADYSAMATEHALSDTTGVMPGLKFEN